MPRLLVLDSGPIGLLTYSKATANAKACRQWVRAHAERGTRVIVPEIADYEVRRELLRMELTGGLLRLNSLVTLANVSYLPITTEAMRLAAEFWAQSRRSGRPTADPKELDGDVILAAQAFLATGEDDQVIVATTNAVHLSRFVPAAAWRDIPPE